MMIQDNATKEEHAAIKISIKDNELETLVEATAPFVEDPSD